MNYFQKRSLFPYHKKGSILIIAIWILVFFSILSVGLYKIVNSQISIVKTIEDRCLSQYLAKAAYTYATLERKKDKLAYDSFYQLKVKREKELGRGKFIYTFIDEESKININSATPEIIASLPGLTLELAKAITGSPLRPFHVKEEILLVEGINEEAFNQCKDFITVYSNGKVNINTAPVETLRALGLSDNVITTINDFRIGRDNKELTEDDGIFQNSSEIIAKLEDYGEISDSDVTILNQLNASGLIVVKSTNLSLETETKIVGRHGMKYTIVMDTQKIKEWREY
jgi:DNA uptake protein ComE-like DNA-binding protein